MTTGLFLSVYNPGISFRVIYSPEQVVSPEMVIDGCKKMTSAI